MNVELRSPFPNSVTKQPGDEYAVQQIVQVNALSQSSNHRQSFAHYPSPLEEKLFWSCFLIWWHPLGAFSYSTTNFAYQKNDWGGKWILRKTNSQGNLVFLHNAHNLNAKWNRIAFLYSMASWSLVRSVESMPRPIKTQRAKIIKDKKEEGKTRRFYVVPQLGSWVHPRLTSVFTMYRTNK